MRVLLRAPALGRLARVGLVVLATLALTAATVGAAGAAGTPAAGGCGVRAGTGRPPSLQRRATCEAVVARQVAVREAWEWTLCWDEGEACEARLAWQRPVWEAWAWVLCVDVAPQSAP